MTHYLDVFSPYNKRGISRIKPEFKGFSHQQAKQLHSLMVKITAFFCLNDFIYGIYILNIIKI